MTLERKVPLKRSPIKRTASQLARSAIKRRPGRKDNEFSAKVRAEVTRRAGGRCERCRHAHIEHFHHRKLRKQGGDGSAENCAALCRSCHESVHRNPAISYEQGWLVHAWGA